MSKPLTLELAFAVRDVLHEARAAEEDVHFPTFDLEPLRVLVSRRRLLRKPLSHYLDFQHANVCVCVSKSNS